MKRGTQVFANLEEYNGSKYPKFIKDVLKATAFDTLAALRVLGKNSIEQIESAVNANKTLVKDTVYVDDQGNFKNSPFKFLPGHEALLLSISVDIEKFLQKKSAKKSEKQKPPIKDLKSQLMNKVNKYLKIRKIDLKIEFGDLTNFTSIVRPNGNSRITCLARCPNCSNKLKCVYYSSWKNSNYCVHLLQCVKNKTIVTTNPSETFESQPKIQRVGDSSSISNILSEATSVATLNR